jgi:hypothetical protein
MVGFVCGMMFESNQYNKTLATSEANPLTIVWFTYV